MIDMTFLTVIILIADMTCHIIYLDCHWYFCQFCFSEDNNNFVRTTRWHDHAQIYTESKGPPPPKFLAQAIDLLRAGKKSKDFLKYLHFCREGHISLKFLGVWVLPERSAGTSGSPYIFLHEPPAALQLLLPLPFHISLPFCFPVALALNLP